MGAPATYRTGTGGLAHLFILLASAERWRKLRAPRSWPTGEQMTPRFKLLGRLASLHPFARDTRVIFEEEGHRYKVDGKTVPSSVTTILGKFHSHFDGAAAIKKMRQGRCWPTKRLEFLTPEGREMTDDEIL